MTASRPTGRHYQPNSFPYFTDNSAIRIHHRFAAGSTETSHSRATPVNPGPSLGYGKVSSASDAYQLMSNERASPNGSYGLSALPSSRFHLAERFCSRYRQALAWALGFGVLSASLNDYDAVSPLFIKEAATLAGYGGQAAGSQTLVSWLSKLVELWQAQFSSAP